MAVCSRGFLGIAAFDLAPLWETSSMRTFGLKVLIVVVAALVGTAVIHSLVYLSIDPGSLSAQMPR
jgi:hypothetical protein